MNNEVQLNLLRKSAAITEVSKEFLQFTITSMFAEQNSKPAHQHRLSLIKIFAVCPGNSQGLIDRILGENAPEGVYTFFRSELHFGGDTSSWLVNRKSQLFPFVKWWGNIMLEHLYAVMYLDLFPEINHFRGSNFIIFSFDSLPMRIGCRGKRYDPLGANSFQ